MININDIREHVVSILNKLLPVTLTYHNAAHTLSVEKECVTIAREEGITDEKTLLELQIAALYHDIGYLYLYKGHEDKSCELAKKELPRFGVKEEDITTICEIIMATKIPQIPKTLLQKIICDADLNYLGRDEFFIINEELRKEFLEYKIVANDKEWKDSTIEFLQSHSYFTRSSQQRRNPGKQKHLDELILQKNNKV